MRSSLLVLGGARSGKSGRQEEGQQNHPIQAKEAGKGLQKPGAVGEKALPGINPV